MNDKADILAASLKLLLEENTKEAGAYLDTHYPFKPIIRKSRSWSRKKVITICQRDGYCDRYTGKKLVFPGALQVIHLLLPDQFPADKNWSMAKTHMAFWELFPTIDHVFPIARGGEDEESNWATTSMRMNQIKANWTLEEIGWRLIPIEELKPWDGLEVMTLRLVEKHQILQEDDYLLRWYKALIGFRSK
ncbi:HNH endonuclease [bacterium]|nr:HNH endonuclease [bacterium]